MIDKIKKFIKEFLRREFEKRRSKEKRS